MVIFPEKQDFIISYDDKLKVKGYLRVNIKILFSFFILIFLLSYKLIFYLARFKIDEKNSRLDVIFIVLFFVILYIPMLKISNEEKSVIENRTLTVYEPFIINGKINLNFGKNFNNWFSDRFNFREKIIELNKYFVFRYGSNILITKRVVGEIKKSKWLFCALDNSVKNYSNQELYDLKTLEKMTANLNKINDYCKENNKKFYFFIAPDKNKIYPEYFPKIIRKIRPDEESKTFQFIDYLNKNTDIKVIYPYQILLEHKKDDMLYYKQDTHWNFAGAFWGYTELIKKIREDFKDIKTAEVKNYSYSTMQEQGRGDLLKLAGLSNLDETKYKIPENNVDYKCSSQNFRDVSIKCFNNSGKYNLFVYRDSFTTLMLRYLAETFKSTEAIMVHNVGAKYRINLADCKNADIVVYQVLERYLPNLENIPFDEKGDK